MRLVIAIGGNALLRRGQKLSATNQRENVRRAAESIAKIAQGNELILVHGNGPQIGLLALQAAAYIPIEPYPLDVLGAQTEGMIGYWLEQEIDNCLPDARTVATLLTRIEVDANDPAFAAPSKPIGPMYDQAQALRLSTEHGWAVSHDEMGFRRVVPSPEPLRIVNINPIVWLLEHDAVVVCGGGGGIPVVAKGAGHALVGVEAVIDKDLCAALLAEELKADCLLILTDVDAVYLNWGTPEQEELSFATPSMLRGVAFAAGSMAPKIKAACQFAQRTGKPAYIGAMEQVGEILEGNAGTQIALNDLEERSV
jgi:carbamate kinase